MTEEDNRQSVDILSYIEGRMKGLENTIQGLVENTGEEQPVKTYQQVDTPWQCEKCTRTLGFYDEGKDILRVRYRGMAWFVHLGRGGFIETNCWGCSAGNRIDYVESGTDEARKS